MTDTMVSSASREVVIGFDRPFCLIGERINPTGRKKLAEEMAKGHLYRVAADAMAQVDAGAHMLDVNAGVRRDARGRDRSGPEAALCRSRPTRS
jgi:5-methyltetrahydrofolate--homocysteine methyltransferase